jgi:tRNA pseudouridine55 synthase
VAKLSLRVSKGYYVRSLARDLGDRIGVPSHLSALRRTSSGSFSLADACALHADDIERRLLGTADAAQRTLPAVTLTERGAEDARQGRVVPLSEISGAPTGPSVWLDEAGVLVAIGDVGDSGGRVLRGFRA